MKKISLETSDFTTLITNNYQYIDKTRYIHQLTERKYFFLARPRRFGKTLLISTLEALYSGKKELFNNLWIASSDYAWQEHPVIRLDFSSFGHTTAEELLRRITLELAHIGSLYGLTIERNEGPEYALKMLVTALAQKNNVVILIDEYDSPLLQHINDVEEVQKRQLILQGFYSTVKSLDKYLQFVFITGIAKFTKTSLFSGMNNLIDISMDPDYAQLLGYTEDELKENFADHLTKHAHHFSMTVSELINKMRHWYNGYRFSKTTDQVYNPFSVSYFLNSGDFNNYWFESGTPTLLVKLIEQNKYDIQDLRDVSLARSGMVTFNIQEKIPFVPLLLQTGYLTITGYDAATENYTLNYPNKEVEMSFLTYFLGAFTAVPQEDSKTAVARLARALSDADLKLFFSTLHTFIAKIPYDIHVKKEKYYQTIFYVVASLLGIHVEAEVRTNKGRIDAVITTPKEIFIFEFKIDESSADALQQIDDMAYYEKYLDAGKKITLIGVEFDTEARNIAPDWVARVLESTT